MNRLLPASIFVVASLVATCSGAQSVAADPVLVESSKANVTRADFTGELLRVPPDMRGSFATDPKRVGNMIDNILTMKQLAAAARENGVDRDPTVARRIALETERVLAQLQVQRFEEEAGRDFDARQSQFLLKAKERYAIDKDKYRSPEQKSFSYIVFDVTKRGPDAALALARETRAKLEAGADFATMARERSDDPSAKVTGGALPAGALTQPDPAVNAAVAALANPGDITQPVLSRSGYELIRLNAMQPARQLTFDEAKDTIMADLRKQYVDDQREARVNALHNDPTIKLNTQAIDALIVRAPDPILLRPVAPK